MLHGLVPLVVMGGMGDRYDSVGYQPPRMQGRADRKLILYKPMLLKYLPMVWRYGNPAENTSMNEESMT